MLLTPLTHPLVLAALGRGGHESLVLIADGNYPHATARGPDAEVAYLNYAPGVISATDALGPLTRTVPIEAAWVMAPEETGPHAMADEPPIFAEFRRLLGSTDAGGPEPVEKWAFYDKVRDPRHLLTIATAETRIYGNLLLKIGVRKD